MSNLSRWRYKLNVRIECTHFLPVTSADPSSDMDRWERLIRASPKRDERNIYRHSATRQIGNFHLLYAEAWTNIKLEVSGKWPGEEILLKILRMRVCSLLTRPSASIRNHSPAEQNVGQFILCHVSLNLNKIPICLFSTISTSSSPLSQPEPTAVWMAW